MELGNAGRDASKSTKKFRLSPKALKITAIVILPLAILGGVFYAGMQYGASQQKTASQQQAKPVPAASNRWVQLGTITDVNGSSIKVKNSAGKEQQAAINSDTTITDKGAKKVAVDTLKKDQKVIVSGTKDDKGNYTATRIRLQ